MMRIVTAYYLLCECIAVSVPWKSQSSSFLYHHLGSITIRKHDLAKMSLTRSPLMVLAMAGIAEANNALNVNTNTQDNKSVDIAITTWGSDWY